MEELIWILPPLLIGMLVVHHWTEAPPAGPAWIGWSLVAGGGAALGIGISSCAFFVFAVLLGTPSSVPLFEAAALIGLGYLEVRRARRPHPVPANQNCSNLQFLVLLGLLMAAGVATAAMATAWHANPYGDWDAWGLWNLRAKMLASDHALAARAWSPMLAATTHPEYPLMLSSFVARCWAFSHSQSQAVPLATSYLFFLALLGVVWGGVSWLRGRVLGGLSALVLAATPSLLQQVPNQYADVPLACYFSAAILFALLDHPVLAGAFAGLAAWTKDEGVVFLILFVAAVVVLRRSHWIRCVLGAMPAAALAAFFKLVLARGDGSLLSSSIGGALPRLIDASRYWTIIRSSAHEFLNMGATWYHPLLPLVVLAFALRFGREQWRQAAFCAIFLTGLLASDFGVYLITSNSLEWQLRTSLSRLLVQAWPVFVLTLAMALRPPQAAVP